MDSELFSPIPSTYKPSLSSIYLFLSCLIIKGDELTDIVSSNYLKWIRSLSTPIVASVANNLFFLAPCFPMYQQEWISLALLHLSEHLNRGVNSKLVIQVFFFLS